GLFEMACIEDGWFYFTLADSTPEVSGRASIPTVLEGLSSQVTEWRELVEAFPFDAMVHMSSSTPADEVQIRADQWQLLTLVGAGREVHDVLSASSLHPLDTLRTLRELAGGQLVWVEAGGDGETAEDVPATPVGKGDQTNGTAPPADTTQESESAAADGTPATPNGTAGDGTTPKSGAEKSVAPEQLQGPVMPPPISGDPWSSSLATPAASGTQPADDRS
ncbi:MAG TPA: hypothetical protein VMB82_08285, partial [Acidimicrobiales bacterium]|nr:hypothetical protein [Acidimicrobiales bacterium]